jgi:hypothetical protein
VNTLDKAPFMAIAVPNPGQTRRIAEADRSRGEKSGLRKLALF